MFCTRQEFTQTTGIFHANCKVKLHLLLIISTENLGSFSSDNIYKACRSPRTRSSTAIKQLSLGSPETSVPGWKKMNFCTQDLNLWFWPWHEFSWTTNCDLSFLLQIDPYPITAYRSEKTKFHRDSTATCNSSQKTRPDTVRVAPYWTDIQG